MANVIRVLGISGSLRKGSYNTGLLHAAAELLPEGMTLEVADISSIPLYNQDVNAQGYPPVVQAFRDQIAAADALLFATPEYNYSIPGVLKNAIDWASRPPNTTASVGGDCASVKARAPHCGARCQAVGAPRQPA